MEHRKQMTFYVSFWEAINNLSKKDQLPVIRATIAYGLFGEHNENLTTSQKAFFALIKPTLDSSRKKASCGRKGGSKPQANASKAKASSKQTASENEGEYETEYEGECEYEVETENECLEDLCGGAGDRPREAPAERLALIGLQPGEYLPYVTEDTVQAVLSLSYRLIPSAGRAPFPADRRHIFIRAFSCSATGQWQVSSDALDLLTYAFGEAASAGKPGVWSYINGILGRLSSRGITTLQQAREFDESRPDKEDLA